VELNQINQLDGYKSTSFEALNAEQKYKSDLFDPQEVSRKNSSKPQARQPKTTDLLAQAVMRRHREGAEVDIHQHFTLGTLTQHLYSQYLSNYRIIHYSLEQAVERYQAEGNNLNKINQVAIDLIYVKSSKLGQDISDITAFHPNPTPKAREMAREIAGTQESLPLIAAIYLLTSGVHFGGKGLRKKVEAISEKNWNTDNPQKVATHYFQYPNEIESILEVKIRTADLIELDRNRDRIDARVDAVHEYFMSQIDQIQFTPQEQSELKAHVGDWFGKLILMLKEIGQNVSEPPSEESSDQLSSSMSLSDLSDLNLALVDLD
jgi:hypothetical protein